MPCLHHVLMRLLLSVLVLALGVMVLGFPVQYALAQGGDSQADKAWKSLRTSGCNNAAALDKTLDGVGRTIREAEELRRNIVANKEYAAVVKTLDAALAELRTVRDGYQSFRAAMKATCSLSRPQGLSGKQEADLYAAKQAEFRKAADAAEALAPRYDRAFQLHARAFKEYNQVLTTPIPVQ